jgi:hypothetical protein|tara:strand:- start:220 stop:468 length:249 start_codon:yes stop_codon:yes gene_type:complete
LPEPHDPTPYLTVIARRPGIPPPLERLNQKAPTKVTDLWYFLDLKECTGDKIMKAGSDGTHNSTRKIYAPGIARSNEYQFLR